ncbi:N-acetylneuraminate synthase [Nonlabens ulvanivorans]|nr:SAF domain-containing protein [Nonlabens ulvanivorans]GAK91045.1 N-acetylneuraminate synthase [Nonlabens ulvanivorans]GAK94370.1 N-acetylneuraminate synthase [Nonlabens ulvanivorans]
MVNAVREAEAVIGKIDYEMTDKKLKSREFSRSLYVVEDIKKGERFTAKNVRSIRPGFGLHPKHFNEVLKSNASRDLERGTPLSLSFID